MFDILCLGEPLVELNHDRTAGPTVYRLGCGGDTSNCAVAAARQGGRVAYWTRLGNDGFGDVFIDLWTAAGVDCSRVVRDDAAFTGAYVVHHGPHGHRFTYLRQGSAASRMTPACLPADLFDGVRLLHLSAISQAISLGACDTCFAAIEQARAKGALVAYDTNLRLKLWPLARARAIVDATVGLADILLPSLDDARLLTGLEDPAAIARHYLARGPKIVALTLGKDGALVATADRQVHVPSLTVDAVDATGAGDAFDGGFLVRYLECGDPFEAGRYGTVTAALSTRGYGAVDPLPSRAEVEAAVARLG